MPLKYQPKVGFVVVCDFSGLKEPEMIKTRPVVILARNRQNNKLVTVVPLSTTAPSKVHNCHHELSHNPIPDQTGAVWAKCDMIYTLSVDRLDAYRIKTRSGRKYIETNIHTNDLECIRACVAAALGLANINKA